MRRLLRRKIFVEAIIVIALLPLAGYAMSLPSVYSTCDPLFKRGICPTSSGTPSFTAADVTLFFLCARCSRTILE